LAEAHPTLWQLFETPEFLHFSNARKQPDVKLYDPLIPS
jgi:hypothetical protein